MAEERDVTVRNAERRPLPTNVENILWCWKTGLHAHDPLDKTCSCENRLRAAILEALVEAKEAGRIEQKERDFGTGR